MKCENAILGWLQGERLAKEKMSETLERVLKDNRKTQTLLKNICRFPRDNKRAYRQFKNAFSNPQDWYKWLWTYNVAYLKFMDKLYKKADKIEDILKIIPNLSPWTLADRFGTIRIGAIPKEFVSEKLFLELVSKVNRSRPVQTYKKIKKLECHLPTFQKAFPAVRKIDWFDFEKRSDFLRTLVKAKCGSPFSVRVGNQTYHVTFLCNPFSSKLVFEIQTPKQHTYILKTALYSFLNVQNDRVRKEHENMAIRADSTYSDAMLEFYLKLNKCAHAPNILYYHFDHEVALYQAEPGKTLTTLPGIEKKMDFYTFNTQVIPDSTRLGVYMNDINIGNFLVAEKTKTVKIIDIGHATFANPLTPGIPGKTFSFGNLSGRDYVLINGVLDVEDV